ncbi:MAG TPA: hypothetical protein VE011_09640 [Candidatus Dormibacteraeota bacterium]|nr:hypothetical protein [Candidatus Dormibacteraeota bacterium]
MIVVGILGSGSGAVLEIARRAAATGARTEVVGAASGGAEGDRQLLQVASAGVGHATVTRSAAGPEPGIEPADLELALRYLPDVRAIVLVAPAGPLLATAAAAAGFTAATVVVVGPVDAAALDAVGSPQLIVLDPPGRDPDGAFAGVVAALATRLDAGDEPAAAWAATVSMLAVEGAPSAAT